MTPALAIHPGALGDVLLSVPALRALRRSAGALTLAAQPRIGALLAALGIADRHVEFDALHLDALFVDDDAAQPELPAVSRIVSWFGARDEVFRRRLTELAPDVVVAPSVGQGRLVWEHLVATVAASAEEASREPIAVAERLRDEGRAALARAGWDGRAPLLFAHPGAGGPAKRWPVEAFAAALERVAGETGAALVVHEGPADAAAAAALQARLPRVHVVREPPLPVLAGALTHATAFLGNDSGIGHLAAAVGAPSVLLFTAEHRRWVPWASVARPLTVTTTRVDAAEVGDVTAALLRLGLVRELDERKG